MMPVATLIEKLIGKRKAADAEILQSYEQLVDRLAADGPEPKVEVVDQLLESVGRTPEQLCQDVSEAKLVGSKRDELAKKAAAEADLVAAEAEMKAAATERATAIEAANRKHAAIVNACKERIQQAGVAIRLASDAHVWLLEHSKHREEIKRLCAEAAQTGEPLRGDAFEAGLLEARRDLQNQLSAVSRQIRTAGPRELPELEAEQERITDQLTRIDQKIVATESELKPLQDRIRSLEQQALSA